MNDYIKIMQSKYKYPVNNLSFRLDDFKIVNCDLCGVDDAKIIYKEGLFNICKISKLLYYISLGKYFLPFCSSIVTAGRKQQSGLKLIVKGGSCLVTKVA